MRLTRQWRTGEGGGGGTGAQSHKEEMDATRLQAWREKEAQRLHNMKLKECAAPRAWLPCASRSDPRARRGDRESRTSAAVEAARVIEEKRAEREAKRQEAKDRFTVWKSAQLEKMATKVRGRGWGALLVHRKAAACAIREPLPR